MDADRLNSPHTSAVIFEALGHQLQFSQDPNSKHLGTTVWDASMVLVKFLEKNSRKGKFSPAKLKGKRVVDLGAGCGVAGFGMALLGCDVISTDQVEVLPLLMRNVERNTSRIMQMNPGSDSVGSIKVAELDWGNEDHINALEPPFDFIIGTDVALEGRVRLLLGVGNAANMLHYGVFGPKGNTGFPRSEHLLEPLLQTMLALSGPKTTILIGYEVRSTNVHKKMFELWKRNFEVKIVPKAKLDIKYQHPSIQLFIMTLKPPEGSTLQGTNRQIGEVRTEKAEQVEDDDEASSSGLDEVESVCGDKDKEDMVLLTSPQTGKLSEWEIRRVGAMAARLFRDVQLT